MWDVIVKYSGDIENIPVAGLQITTLLNQYAVIPIPYPVRIILICWERVRKFSFASLSISVTSFGFLVWWLCIFLLRALSFLSIL
ncbi:hypothetical protein [Muricoprocola aceti]|uniref:hypothetical protein n=1 Tax=Muricoprocola aceti TaxID=2981772 RepID=UPI003A892C27